LTTGEPQRIETHSTVLHAPVEINVFPSPSGLSVYFRDISERQRMEQMLRERDEILTLAERSAGIGVWDIDLPTSMARGTAQFFRIMGLEPTASAVPLETLRAIRHSEDRARVVEGFRQAVMSGRDTYEMEYRILRPDGQVRWIFGRGRVVRDSAGTPVRYSGIDIDITERKRAEERLKLLAAEVDHRAKNMLAVVQAMLRLTRAETVPAFIEAFEGRLQALSGAHMLLSESKWEGAELGRLAAQELAPYRSSDGARVAIDGPPVLLEPAAAQAVAMALHELATNAAKYGALSAPEGRVELTWSLGATELALRWSERGGPPVRAPTRRGLGTTVIERSIRDQLGGEARLDWRAEGLACEMTIPIDGRAHAPSAA
jgi:PAS domain S-box-containing protein